MVISHCQKISNCVEKFNFLKIVNKNFRANKLRISVLVNIRIWIFIPKFVIMEEFSIIVFWFSIYIKSRFFGGNIQIIQVALPFKNSQNHSFAAQKLKLIILNFGHNLRFSKSVLFLACYARKDIFLSETFPVTVDSRYSGFLAANFPLAL